MANTGCGLFQHPMREVEDRRLENAIRKSIAAAIPDFKQALSGLQGFDLDRVNQVPKCIFYRCVVLRVLQ